MQSKASTAAVMVSQTFGCLSVDRIVFCRGKCRLNC